MPEVKEMIHENKVLVKGFFSTGIIANPSTQKYPEMRPMKDEELSSISLQKKKDLNGQKLEEKVVPENGLISPSRDKNQSSIFSQNNNLFE